MSFTLGFQLADLLAKFLGVRGGLPEATQTTLGTLGLTPDGAGKTGLSSGELAAAAVLGTAGLATLGLLGAARSFSTTRIEITETEERGTHFLERRGVKSALAGLGLAGLLTGLIFIAPTTGEIPPAPSFPPIGGGGFGITPGAGVTGPTGGGPTGGGTGTVVPTF